MRSKEIIFAAMEIIRKYFSGLSSEQDHQLGMLGEAARQRDALTLIDELEQTLQLRVCAMNWPLGNGPDFQGVYDRQANQAHFFERTSHGSYRAPVALHSVTDPQVRGRMPAGAYESLINELDVLDSAGEEFDLKEVRAGDLSPVFFGSAINNFGVQLMLDAIADYAPPPQPRTTVTDSLIITYAGTGSLYDGCGSRAYGSS